MSQEAIDVAFKANAENAAARRKAEDTARSLAARYEVTLKQVELRDQYIEWLSDQRLVPGGKSARLPTSEGSRWFAVRPGATEIQLVEIPVEFRCFYNLEGPDEW